MAATSPDRPRSTAPALWWSLLLLAAVGSVFAKVGSFEFVHYDDLTYLFGQPFVRQGLTGASVAWAFTEPVLYNWHPLTLLSYLLDAELWGMSPRAFHLVNVALHGANTVVLFLLLARLTGHRTRSAIVAALFALHPLHVESVAWVSARKDVLSTLFFLLTIGAYVSWLGRPGRWRYASMLGLYALGLMSKPMLVTLPFVLLLLDHWPLGRYEPAARLRLGPLALEKAPLFALAVASCVVTLGTQAGAMQALAHVTLPERLANAALSYLRYLGMTLWPARLGVLYPMPPHVDLATGALAALLLVIVSVVVLRSARRQPWLFTGWFWYLGTLVPVIGLVQVGVQSHADRYTYLPLIGVFIAAVWTVGEGIGQRHGARRVAGAAAAVVVALLSVRTWFQLDTWRDSETLYEHALAVAPDSPYIQYNLATLLGEHGRHAEAVPHYREVVRLAPELMAAWSQLALSLAAQGDVAGARRALEEIRPRAADSADVHHATGVVALLQGNLAAAEREASEALRIDPSFERARELLRLVYEERKRRAGETVSPRAGGGRSRPRGRRRALPRRAASGR